MQLEIELPHEDPQESKDSDQPQWKVLNLYAGLGGNRKLWSNVVVTAVELDEQIAEVYQQQHPNDTVIIGDAHQYLLEHFAEFDFIWSSPPCQTHSRMAKATRHELKRYPDMSLYQEILFLRSYFEGKWIVENVIPYYKPLIPPHRIGRHLFWSNFFFSVREEPKPKGFITAGTVGETEKLKEWLGIQYEGSIYYRDNHCPGQVLRNCVHPKLGNQIIQAAREAK